MTDSLALQALKALPRHLAVALGIVGGLGGGAFAHAQAGAECDLQSALPEHLNACAIQRFQEVDTAQNILYSDVMRALAAHERPDLRREQTQWSRQRAAQCKAVHAPDEGLPDWTARYYDCLTAATQARQSDLMHWLHHGQPPRP